MTIRALDLADLDGALRLSMAADWNQRREDWALMLGLGQGFGIDAADDDGATCLAASLVVLPYGSDFAWVSMVLVLPQLRRRGYAQQLLRFALIHLTAQGRAAILDATPAGHAVYVQEGFADTWGLARYRREAAGAAAAQIRAAATRTSGPAAPLTRPLRDDDWAAIVALDAPAFGADRSAVLRALAQRWPQAARVAETRDGRICGFVLGRDGREAHQIGPLLAADDAVAAALLDDVLQVTAGPLYVDLLDRRSALLPQLRAAGFTLQRPFTRMVHGALRAPGDPAPIVLAAGPELG